MNRKKIVFWLPCYPDVMYSFIEELSRREENDLTVVCLSDLPEERREIYEQNTLGKMCRIVICSEEISLSENVKKIISDNIDAVHIFGGFLGRVGEVLNHYRDFGYKKAIIITEKPSVVPSKYFGGIIKALKKARSKRVYGKRYKSIKECVAAVFVTGKSGVEQLASYGVPRDKLYRFMYTHIDEDITLKELSVGNPVKFVYVGRFDYLNRGVDTLKYVFDNVKHENWCLDLVGGYGRDSEAIKKWASSRRGVSFIGSWKNNEVINKLADYDVCISPTRIDGWRIQVNQAIMAGIGTITTNEAVSDELVAASRSGAVVRANKKTQMKRAVEAVLDNPNIVIDWKKNARDYAHKITNQAFADYFLENLEYIFNKQKIEGRPECPW